MTSAEIKNLLANKYASPAYAFFTEVAKGGVASFNGYIDAVAFSLYPSMDHEIHGFEIKVSRSDFLREFEKPDKAGDAMAHCHRWWLVAPKGVCDKNELPKNWGYIEVRGKRMFKVKQAVRLEADYNVSFIAGLLRRGTENSIPKSIFWESVEEEKQRIREGFEADIKMAKENLEKNVSKVKEFEEASGLSIIASYKGGKGLGEAVDMVLRMDNFDYEIRGTEDVLKKLRAINELVKSKLKRTKLGIVNPSQNTTHHDERTRN